MMYIDGWGGNMEKVFTDDVLNTLRAAQPQVLVEEDSEMYRRGCVQPDDHRLGWQNGDYEFGRIERAHTLGD